MRIVGAVEADNVVILVFNPDTSQEAALAGVFLWRDIHYHAADLAEKLAADECEIVKLTLKILIEHHHLCETEGQELHGINVAQLADHAFAESGCGRGREGTVIGPFAHIQASKKVNVAAWDGSAEIFVFLQILEISFYQRVKVLHLGHEEMFAFNRTVDHLIEAGGGIARLLGGGIASR